MHPPPPYRQTPTYVSGLCCGCGCLGVCFRTVPCPRYHCLPTRFPLRHPFDCFRAAALHPCHATSVPSPTCQLRSGLHCRPRRFHCHRSQYHCHPPSSKTCMLGRGATRALSGAGQGGSGTLRQSRDLDCGGRWACCTVDNGVCGGEGGAFIGGVCKPPRSLKIWVALVSRRILNFPIG